MGDHIAVRGAPGTHFCGDFFLGPNSDPTEILAITLNFLTDLLKENSDLVQNVAISKYRATKYAGGSIPPKLSFRGYIFMFKCGKNPKTPCARFLGPGDLAHLAQLGP